MQGSCLCGDIRYRVQQLDRPISHCHCRTCRKAHAAAYATTAGVLREHFEWVRGAERVASYESSPGKQRRFCPRCGTHLVAEREGQPYLIVRVATLDDDPGAWPEMHIWTSHDVPWVSDRDGIPRYEGWPPGR
jgi:ADP-ribosyl-[dinitrogen reductase] hydrolase